MGGMGCQTFECKSDAIEVCPSHVIVIALAVGRRSPNKSFCTAELRGFDNGVYPEKTIYKT